MRNAIFVIFLIICILTSSLSVFAGSYRGYGKAGYLKQDSLDKSRTNIYGKDGNREGYLKRDSLFKDRVNIYNERGERKGYLKKDTLFKDRTNVFDETGDRKGYLKKDSLFDDRTNIYNNEGGLLKDGAIVLSSAKSTTIKYCNIYDNACNGLAIVSIFYNNQNEANKIYNCNFFNNYGDGILLSMFSSYTEIYNNNFYHNEVYGVEIGVATGAIYNDINNNNFAENNGNGKDAYDGSLGDDIWAYNFWKGHTGGPYYIPGLGNDWDYNPQEDIIPSERVVIDDTGENLYLSIKDAVERVATGGIVKVYGSHIIDESIEIIKSLELIGYGATIVYIVEDDAAIKVQATNVKIDSFNIQGPGMTTDTDGILVTEGDSVIINNCEIHVFGNGIHLKDGGVQITNCGDPVDGGGMYSNTNGIFIDSCSGNTISNSYFHHNTDGIKLGGSSSSTSNNVEYCAFNDNDNGVHLIGAETNTILECNFEENIESGVLIELSSNSNYIQKCMFEDNDYGISIDENSSSNNIYYNHFSFNSQNANDEGSNTWDDGEGRGNCWDDYLGLDTDYNGIGDDPPFYGIPGGGNQDNFPIAASGRYAESIRPYSIEYWNPSGESVILVSMDLNPKQNKIIHLYYGSDRNVDSIVKAEGKSKSYGGIAVEPIAFRDYDIYQSGGCEYTGIFEEGDYHLVYQIPALDPPEIVEDAHTKNEIMYVIAGSTVTLFAFGAVIYSKLYDKYKKKDKK